jgi:hypothetical protein
MPHDLEISLPACLGVLGLAADTKVQGCGRWITSAIEMQIRDGRFTATAASLHLCAIAEGPLAAAEDRPQRVLLPARLWQSVCQQATDAGSEAVEVRLTATGTRLSFGTGSRRTMTDVPPLEGMLPPVAEVIRATRTSKRQSPEYMLGPKALAKLLRITRTICPDAPLQLAMGPGGRLRVDARSGKTTVALVFATPPGNSGDSGSCEVD